MSTQDGAMVRLPADLIAALDEVAEAEHRSRSNMATVLLMKAIPRAALAKSEPIRPHLVDNKRWQ